jgi:hypothetical protein
MTGEARDLPVIQGLWVGGELSVIERLSTASFLENGHRVHLYTYEGVTGAPEGTESGTGAGYSAPSAPSSTSAKAATRDSRTSFATSCCSSAGSTGRTSTSCV